VREYNEELERREKDKVTARMLFPGRPDLIALLESLQKNWVAERLRR
jgi:hypothetical protein